MPSSDGELVCPRCGLEHAPTERLCSSCGMPLVLAGDEELAPTGPGHEQARKIHPRYARGELERVTVARNLAEAELIKGVLLEQGIPSLIRRTAGFDVPDFLAAGPRDILVPETGAQEARRLLGEIDEEHGEAQEPNLNPRPVEFRLAAVLLALLLALGAVAGLLVGLTR